MKPEEALDILKRMRIALVTGRVDGIRVLEPLNIAVEATEKQIPLKPQLESDGYSDGELVYDTWICPKCGEDYEIDCHDYKYCPECGQRIDRGDIE